MEESPYHDVGLPKILEITIVGQTTSIFKILANSTL